LFRQFRLPSFSQIAGPFVLLIFDHNLANLKTALLGYRAKLGNNALQPKPLQQNAGGIGLEGRDTLHSV
jgi:hypothetical protein